jgi:hypothetical protein
MRQKLISKGVPEMISETFIQHKQPARVMFLSGVVGTSWEYHRAGRIAEGVEGVVHVSNHLEYSHKWLWKPDWEIERNVEAHLYDYYDRKTYWD